MIRLVTSILVLASVLWASHASAGVLPALRIANDGGATTGYVRVADDPGLEPATFTIEAWVTPLGPVQGGNDFYGGVLIGKSAEGTVGSWLGSWFLTWSSQDESVTLNVTHLLNSEGVLITTPLGVVPLSSTTHVAATFDGSTLSIYVDGVLQVSGDFPFPSVYYGDEDVLIGAANFGTGFLRRFDGILDEVRLWDHSRSEQEIGALMGCRLTGDEAGLLAYWSFDGSDLVDGSGNGHDGLFEETAGTFVNEQTTLTDCPTPIETSTWGGIKATYTD